MDTKNIEAMTNPNLFASSDKTSSNSLNNLNKKPWFEKILEFISTNFIKRPPFGLVSNNILKKLAFALITLALLAIIRPIYSINDTHKLFEFYCISFWFIGIAIMIFIIDPYNIKNAEYAFKENKLTTFGGIGNEVSNAVVEDIVTTTVPI